MMSGQVDSEILAGVGNADTLLLVLVSLFDGFSYGGAALTGRYYEKKDHDSFFCIAVSALFLGLGAGIIFTAFFHIFKVPILNLLFPKASRSVFSAMKEYLSFAAFSLPVAFLFSQLSAILRSAGDSITPLIAGLFANIVNIFAGACLILGMFGIKGLGAAGAGITLLTARIAGLSVLVIISMCRKKSRYFQKMTIKDFVSHFFEIIKIGLPSALETSSFYISRLVLQIMVVSLGTLANASYLVFQSLVSVYSLIVDSTAIVMFHIMSNYTGTGEREKCRNFAAWAIKASWILSTGTSVLILFTRKFTPGIYSSSDQITQIVSRMLFALVYTMLSWPWSWLLPSLFRGTGDVRFPATISVGCTWIIRIGGTFFMIHYLNFGIYSAATAIALDCTVRAILFYLYYLKWKWLCNIERITSEEKE